MVQRKVDMEESIALRHCVNSQGQEYSAAQRDVQDTDMVGSR